MRITFIGATHEVIGSPAGKEDCEDSRGDR